MTVLLVDVCKDVPAGDPVSNYSRIVIKLII